MENKSVALGNELPPNFNKKQVNTALEALYSYVEKQSHSDALELLDEKPKINLQLTFKKVPNVKSKVIKVELPHGISQETADVCLFVKDLDKSERDYAPTVRHFKELLGSKGVKNITEVLPMKAVKTEYQPFEAKRNLANAYEVFLADDRIVRLLPGFLGKHFYSRKRFPLAVNLKATDLQKEITRALKTTQCALGGVGSTCQVTVSHTGLSTQQSAENIIAAIHKLCTDIPGGATNIRSLYLKTVDSPALPIYANTDSAVDVVLPARPKKPVPEEPEELSTMMEGKVRVSRHGNIQIIGGEVKNNNQKQKQEPQKKKAPKQQPQKKKAPKAQKAAETEEQPLVQRAKRQKTEPLKEQDSSDEENSVSKEEEENESSVEEPSADSDEEEKKAKLGKRRASGTSVDQWMKKAKSKELPKAKPTSKRLKKK